MARTWVLLLLTAQAVLPQQQPATELGMGWLPEFNLAARQILSLAEAIPAEKYAWRPAPGVRSTSEVLMHTVLANYGIQAQAGGSVPKEVVEALNDGERRIVEKAAVVDWLKKSFAVARDSYGKLDRTKKVKFLGKETTADAVFLRLLVHNHEHMGQMIAYARMMGVAPPWSKGAKD